MAPQSRVPPVDPDVARSAIARLIPREVRDPGVWAADIFTAFEALELAPSAENTCATLAITQQESTFQVNPTVPALPAIASREIVTRATRYHVPEILIDAALGLRSTNGQTYRDRIQHARSEKALSDTFEDFIGRVPLGKTLFADWNPIRTGGPMQVSIAFAEKYAAEKRYPYPVPGSIRDEVFTRRGGLYFGIAHLLDYSAPYADTLFRFADFNAGQYASRNAAFQNAVSIVSGVALELDGDLLRYDGTPSKTELALRKAADAIKLGESGIHRDLELEKEAGFEQSDLYKRVFERADNRRRRMVPRSMLPRIRLDSPKITRKLTTEWFANRVNERYQQCLKRASGARTP
ncbi:MAG TPA: DUF1615 domain-containing protein [Steroidobacteraceae bacterium]